MGALGRMLPKPLCPVATTPLVDGALARVAAAVAVEEGRPATAEDLAVNVCHGRDRLLEHLAGRVFVSVEPVALGTAGALGQLRPWLAGRDALVVNGDTWCRADLAAFVAGWDGARVAVLVSGGVPLHSRSGIVASLLPWAEVARLPAQPLGLWEGLWKARLGAGLLHSVGYEGPFVDCATPADYLRANLEALQACGVATLVAPGAQVVAGASVGPGCVVGAGAVVAGAIEQTVVWPGATVDASEQLRSAIRATGDVTVLVR